MVDIIKRNCYIYFGNFLGIDAVLLKDGTRLCGNGGALATEPIMQNKAYFEVTVQQTGLLYCIYLRFLQFIR